MLIEVTPPAAEPVTLAEAKQHCRIEIEDTEEDSLVGGLISAARARVEVFTRRRLVAQTVELRRSGLGCSVPLPVGPVRAVSSITYLDIDGAEQTLAADQYRLDRSVQPMRIIPAHLVTWPVVLFDTDTVGVTLEVGYGAPAEVPPQFKAAMLMLIGHWYENREAVVTGTIATELPVGVSALLTPHILWV